MKKIWIIAVYREEETDIINRVSFDYVRAVELSGALAYIIPCNTQHIDHFIQEMDGFIFPGAKEDVTPGLYWEKNTRSHDCVEQNDRFLLDTMDRIYTLQKPILGICKWHQVINTYFGGTLIQDIRNSDLHLCLDTPRDTVHTVSIQKREFFIWNI